MNRKNIITLPNPHLRQNSKRIHVITDDVTQLIQDMESATLDWEDSRPHELGVALAAIQVDKPYNVVIIRNDFDDKDDRSFLALINPEIVKLEGAIEYDYEGCLSIKNLYGRVPRYHKVRVKALDASGKPIKFKAEGFLARVLQHEIDHTNGIVFIDHIKNDDAFFTLTKDGELEKLSHEKVLESDILW
jgi:peptide deformylase